MTLLEETQSMRDTVAKVIESCKADGRKPEDIADLLESYFELTLAIEKIKKQAND